MPETAAGADVTCRLRREDGSEWAVSAFDLRNGGAWVTAAPIGADGSAGRELREEPLDYGDRLEWVRGDGTVVWAMRNPTGVGLRWEEREEAAGADDEAFFEGDFGEEALRAS